MSGIAVVSPLSANGAEERVCAIVVTHNRSALLRACLVALQAQTRPVDTLLVVDNASTDGTRAMLRADFPAAATVLALPTNVGGAGGFHAGMKWAYAQGYDWLWIMDDDGHPAPDCLARLLAHARPDRVLVPLQRDSGGRRYGIGMWRGRRVEATEAIASGGQPVTGAFIFNFVGPLVARGVVAAVGLPIKDFFIHFDDWEYGLRLRRRLGEVVTVVPDALFFHDYGTNTRQVRFLGQRSNRAEQPPWKTYYGTRNYLYTLLRLMPDWQGLLVFALVQLRFLLMDFTYGPERWAQVRMRALGLCDGATGRLGKRV